MSVSLLCALTQQYGPDPWKEFIRRQTVLGIPGDAIHIKETPAVVTLEHAQHTVENGHQLSLGRPLLVIRVQVAPIRLLIFSDIQDLNSFRKSKFI